MPLGVPRYTYGAEAGKRSHAVSRLVADEGAGCLEPPVSSRLRAMYFLESRRPWAMPRRCSGRPLIASVRRAWSLEVGQHVRGGLLERATEGDGFAQGGRDAVADRVDRLRYEFAAAPARGLAVRRDAPLVVAPRSPRPASACRSRTSAVRGRDGAR